MGWPSSRRPIDASVKAVRGSSTAGLERILIRCPNWLGDLILARPLLHLLRESFPAAEITAVAPAGLLDLIEPDGVADRHAPWPRERDSRRALVAGLRRKPADAALVLPPSFSSAWFAFRCRAAVRIGYAHEGRSMLLTEALARPARGERHLSAEYAALATPLGVALSADDLPPALAVPERGAAEAAALMERHGLDGAALAVLGPGATYGPAKRWPAERFAAVATRLESRGFRVAVCGTAAERAVCAEVAARAGGRVLSLAGETGLPALSWLCGRARIAVCNDSGLAHLCAALGTPTVVVFGSSSSAWSAPRGPRVRILQRAPVCSPCFRRTCRIGYRCLDRVTVEAVDRACEALAA